MFSILNKLLPSLKSRLLLTVSLILTSLTALTLSITYFSMSKAIDTRMFSQMENRFISLEEEYSEELEEHEEHEEHKKSREARKELAEKIQELDDILEDRNEWIFLVSPENKLLLASENAPDYKLLKFHERESGSSLHEKTEFLYRKFELPDECILILTADLKEKNEYMVLYRNRFLTASLAVTVIGILICLLIIRSSLRGFENVRKAADSIADGDYSQRVHSQKGASTEVIELSSSFNKMIDRTQVLLREIKEVSNNVAHDLRTPLTRIRGKIETSLMADADLMEHKELSGIVIEECDKLMLLINNMLTLAEYESGLVKKKNDKINLKEILKNLCEVFETVCEDKNLKISLDLPDEEMTIFGDKEKIQRSLSNLFDNSIKYSDDSGEISISGTVNGSTIEINFIDNGCGISQDDQSRIFERFYRVESSRSTTGNGLGLNLARAFIENHGGKISVNSTPGKGSCFKIQLLTASSPF